MKLKEIKGVRANLLEEMQSSMMKIMQKENLTVQDINDLERLAKITSVLIDDVLYLDKEINV